MNQIYQLQFRPYQRPFKQPLITAQERWSVREGVIIQLTDPAGRVGYGEVAPLPRFGSETQAAAIALLRVIGQTITDTQIDTLSDEFPACQFALESARSTLKGKSGKTDTALGATLEATLEATLRPTRPTSSRPEISRPEISHPPISTANTPTSNTSIAAHSGKRSLDRVASLDLDLGLPICQLLPSGEAALTQISRWAIESAPPDPFTKNLLTELGQIPDQTPEQTQITQTQIPLTQFVTTSPYKTYKWKIGVGAIDVEQQILCELVRRLPLNSRLRLDANGSLSFDEACRWLELCDRLKIEFIEQPLPPPQAQDESNGSSSAFDDHSQNLLHQLDQQFQTPIALDESIRSLADLAYYHAAGWRGVLVIKPAIFGSPQRLQQFCRSQPADRYPDLVFSTVFETAIGRSAGLRLAQALQRPAVRSITQSKGQMMTRSKQEHYHCGRGRDRELDRAVGYGVDHWLEPFDIAQFCSQFSSKDAI